MFLSDEQLEQMTGITRQGRRPGTLRAWLIERGWTENVDFFKRADGWYSVLHPSHENQTTVQRTTTTNGGSMSGGSWDYCYSRMQDVAERLCTEASPERRALGRRLLLISKAMHDIEWVDSGDYGPGDDAKAIAAALGGQKEAAAAALYELVEEARRLNNALEELVEECVGRAD